MLHANVMPNKARVGGFGHRLPTRAHHGASQCVRDSPLLALHAGVMEARVPLGVPLVHVFPRQHRLQLLHLRDTARGRGGGDGEDRVRSLQRERDFKE